MREQSHRRATLLAIAGLILLSTVPVFGHHLPFDVAAILASVQHLGAFCVTALSHLLAPVHWSFHIALAAGVAYAGWDRWRAWSRLRSALTPLDAKPPSPGSDIWRAAMAERLDPQLVRVVDGLPNPAFTAGMVRPRIYVAEDLPSRLTEGELACVLSHEAAHVARRDPLRLSIYRFLGCALFWIPALRRLADDMGDEAEILADDRAAAGRPLVLASAILKISMSRPGRVAEAAVGFDSPDLLDRRIRRLASEDAPVTTHVTRRSLAGAGLALALVLLSGAVAGGP
ncbi:MAG: M56 family metallopeptidase, partial [Gemmatimonadaceae bacterium]